MSNKASHPNPTIIRMLKHNNANVPASLSDQTVTSWIPASSLKISVMYRPPYATIRKIKNHTDLKRGKKLNNTKCSNHNHNTMITLQFVKEITPHVLQTRSLKAKFQYSNFQNLQKLKIQRFYLHFLQKLCSWVSMWTSSSLEGLSAGQSDRQTTAILTAISISSSSPSSPRILLSSASRASPACCKCRSHCPKLPPLTASLKNGWVGSLPVSKTPNNIPKLKTSLLSVYLFQMEI
jgi:hypothetical protein